MLVYGLFIAVGNGGKWALKMIVVYIIVAYLNALLRYVQVPVLSVIMSVFGVTLLKLIPIVMMGLWILRTTYMDDLMVGAPADAASPVIHKRFHRALAETFSLHPHNLETVSDPQLHF